MGVETLIADIEAALVRLIRLGLGYRYPTKATTSELAALNIAVLPDGALCRVTGSGLYEWLTTSTATADGSNVIASTAQPTGKTNGRWVKVSTDWTWGIGGQNLADKTTGYLRAVEPYVSDDADEEALTRVFGNLPAVCVGFTGDDPQSVDMQPGTFYRDELTFNIAILTKNFRPSPAATQGSPFSAEAASDPGAYRIIGDLRKLFMSNAAEPGIAGVERLVIGRAELAFESEDRRVYGWSFDLNVRASFYLDEEDGEDAWSIVAQPVDTAPAPDSTRFDESNYVISGAGLVEGYSSGLSRTIAAAVAKIDGATVTADAESVTFDANKDTYRDLDEEGAWHFTAVDTEAAEPTLATGRLRIGVTRTDGSGVVSDRALCSFSIATSSPVSIDLTSE